jgi:hypothetical protein
MAPLRLALKYILPENHRGAVIVIYDTIDGIKSVYDNGVEIFKIPKDGILKTKSPVHPFLIAQGKVAFYEEEKENKLLREINVFNPLSTNHYEDEVYIQVNGYNQIARDIVNDQLKFSTDKNILFFTIDTLKNLKEKNLYEYFTNSFKKD